MNLMTGAGRVIVYHWYGALCRLEFGDSLCSLNYCLGRVGYYI
jgi:hypothetical protein